MTARHIMGLGGFLGGLVGHRGVGNRAGRYLAHGLRGARTEAHAFRRYVHQQGGMKAAYVAMANGAGGRQGLMNALGTFMEEAPMMSAGLFNAAAGGVAGGLFGALESRVTQGHVSAGHMFAGAVAGGLGMGMEGLRAMVGMNRTSRLHKSWMAARAHPRLTNAALGRQSSFGRRRVAGGRGPVTASLDEIPI